MRFPDASNQTGSVGRWSIRLADAVPGHDAGRSAHAHQVLESCVPDPAAQVAAVRKQMDQVGH